MNMFIIHIIHMTNIIVDMCLISIVTMHKHLMEKTKKQLNSNIWKQKNINFPDPPKAPTQNATSSGAPWAQWTLQTLLAGRGGLNWFLGTPGGLWWSSRDSTPKKWGGSGNGGWRHLCDWLSLCPKQNSVPLFFQTMLCVFPTWLVCNGQSIYELMIWGYTHDLANL